MARTQFTFTFTNAQPGSVVSFSDAVLDHLYAAATGSARLGRPLILNSSNALSVWSDVETLTAMTEDGNGVDISATATRANPSVTTDAGSAGQNPFGSGGSSAVLALSRVFTFADSAALVTGVTIAGWTPAAGDVILAAWFDIDTAFDGTTPAADIYIGDGGTGLFANYQKNGVACDLTQEAVLNAGTNIADRVAIPNTTTLAPGNYSLAGVDPLTVGAAGALVLAAFQDSQGGTALDSTVGSATLRLLVHPGVTVI